MKNKKLKGLLLFALLFLLVGAVSASEDNATSEISVPDDTQDIEQVTDVNDNLADESDDDYTYENDSDDYSEDDESSDELSSLYITPAKTTYSGTAGNKITVSVTVRDYWNDTPVENAKVTFQINGHEYKATTNSNGVASVSFKMPASKAKTTSKTKGSILTKTTTYSKTYTCAVIAQADKYYSDANSFKVVSKKKTVTKKYRVIKKKKTYTIKVKNGEKTYKKPYSYYIGTYKFKNGGYTYILSAMAKKKSYIKFFIKHHYKKNGKWKWTSWKTIKKGYYNEYSYTSGIQVDKLKFRYTQVTYKRIS